MATGGGGGFRLNPQMKVCFVLMSVNREPVGMLRHGTSTCIQCRPVRRTPTLATLKSRRHSRWNILLDEDYRETVYFDELVVCFLKVKPFSSNPVCREFIEQFIQCVLGFQGKSHHVRSRSALLCFASAAEKFV